MTLLLSRKDVESVLTMKDTMEAVEEGFRQFALGNLEMPLRTVIRIPDYNGLNLGMPAYVGGEMDALGLKVVSIYPDNPPKYDLPTTIATVLLNDPKTGAPLAIMDGTFLTAMRTGAVSGVASKYLSKPDANVAGIFGAGVQARTQLMAVAEARELELVKVYDIVPEERERYSQEMSERLGLKVIPVDNPHEAVEGCDIIVTASSARTPVFDGQWLEEGAHINGIGSHSPDARELDETTIIRSKVVADSREAVLAEAGDVMIPISDGVITEDHIHAGLGELITGAKEGRVSDQEITVFKSVGLALQDVATATKVYELCKEQGIGSSINL